MNSALIIMAVFLLITIFLGIQAKKGRDMDLEQWTVGGRGFGSIFIFLLMAGEIYTTFTFLGGSGWAYSKGGAAFYILGYGALMYVISYYLLPPIWKYANKHRLMSQSDYFTKKYNSPYLGVLVALVGVIAMIPYLVTQFQGLGIIVSEASYGIISPTLAVWIGAISVTVYVMVSGIHGSAWTAVLKDFMILAVCIFLGIYLPFHYYGGFEPMFKAINEAKPGFTALQDKGLSTSWFISTVLLTSLGAYMWPHTLGASFSAKSPNVFRKNAIFMPLYQLILMFVFLVGFAAVLQVPGLKNGDLSLLRLSEKTFDPWFIGLIGAAGLLTAIVPGSLILMTSAVMLSKNVVQVLAPKVPDQTVSKLAKYLVPFIALITVFATLKGGTALVPLLLMGYSLVTQLFPSVAFSLLKRNPITKAGAACGIIAGIAVVAYTTISGAAIASLFPSLPQAFKDLNIGVVAMVVNIVVMAVVSLVTKKSRSVQIDEEAEVNIG
ncbi:SSS family solute:Na+ symporter [Scopulibacillus daqui]|uniref:SSS family solute:Na+ symporter n=1 Tax=Scopulibacillus daqui TaxID=1469162 RepID=A0ABS2PV69_9BACL|nr:sodium:solute symporter [Scopulibacillus daqui]MBM7643951.1 SSS family solute:Na+ symporter [Scopulibacillus daqui]